jgi:spore coat protein U-like protein
MRRRRRRSNGVREGAAAAALLSAAYALCAPARAGTDTDAMAVTATVVASCDVAANDLNFLNYDPVSGAPVDASTTLEITCTNGAAYVVALDEGTGAGATIAARRMTSGANTLVYSLYRDAARTTLWGETSGVDTVAGTGSGTQQTLTVYGRAPTAQTAPAGAYADTVTVTVSY